LQIVTIAMPVSSGNLTDTQHITYLQQQPRSVFEMEVAGSPLLLWTQSTGAGGVVFAWDISQDTLRTIDVPFKSPGEQVCVVWSMRWR
jgi:hypothetical protein